MLVGRGIDYLPFFVYTFGQLGQAGLGSGRGQFLVAEVHAEESAGSRCVYNHAEGVLRPDVERIRGDSLTIPWPLETKTTQTSGARLAVRFLTPARIRHDGDLCHEPSFRDLVRALLRRLSSLCYFHCGGELALDFRGLIDKAREIRTVARSLLWQKQERAFTPATAKD